MVIPEDTAPHLPAVLLAVIPAVLGLEAVIPVAAAAVRHPEVIPAAHAPAAVAVPVHLHTGKL